MRRKKDRIVPSEIWEDRLRDRGHSVIVGIDEVGRGAWAGPLVVGAVILPSHHRVLHLRDSKLLTRMERELLSRRIKRLAVSWALGIVEIDELNDMGLGKSLAVAVERAVAGLHSVPDAILIDGKNGYKTLTIPQYPIVKGDQSVRSIAAAAVIAKVERDRIMRTLHRGEKVVRPYRFDLNKGYPSPMHQAALAKVGISNHHRTCFAPIKNLLNIDKIIR